MASGLLELFATGYNGLMGSKNHTRGNDLNADLVGINLPNPARELHDKISHPPRS